MANTFQRRNQLHHLTSPDFRLKWSKEALCINSSQRVRQALKRNLGSKIAAERSFQNENRSSAHRRPEDVVSPPLDQFSWTTLISQHAKRGEGRKALGIYKEMQVRGVEPSSYTFVAALKACSSLHDLQSAKQIHADVVKSGFEFVVHVGTMLVDVYMKCGSLTDARKVFEAMPDRDVVSWNAMILGYAKMGEGEQSLELYARMQDEGFVPNDRTYVAALKACSILATLGDGSPRDDVRLVNEQCLEQVRAIHSRVLKSSDSDVFVETMLADVYAKCGSLIDARDIFEKMPRHDVTSWNAIISGYAHMEKGEEALKLFARMQQEGVVPDERTFVSALRACSNVAGVSEGGDGNKLLMQNQVRCLEQVRAIHSSVVQQGFESRVFIGNILVDAYAKCGSLVDARRVFERMPHRTVVSWNAMISGYAQVEEGEEALQLYVRMQQEGVAPNDRTFVGALKACTCLGSLGKSNESLHMAQKCDLEQVRAIHSNLVKSGCESDIFVGTMLVDAYAKCGSLVEARTVFERLPHRNVVSWTSMILGYSHLEQGEEALALYDRMQVDGVLPNHRTFVAALKACGSVAGLEKGKAIHAQFSKSGYVSSDPFVASALMDMYAKCGSMDDSQQVFDALTKRNAVIWNALIAGYAHQGQTELVFDLFVRMRQDGQQPNGITFLGILTACCYVGLVDKGLMFLKAMTEDFGITPTIEHYNCMVDLLGRSGQVEEAMEMVKTIPFQPPGKIWRTVLGACRKWRNVKLGREAFESAMALDKNDAAAYVLMASIYAAADMWEDAYEVEAMSIHTQSWRQPGKGWSMDMDRNMHAFVVRDQ